MQRIKCDMNRAMQHVTNRLFSSRSYVTRTRNLYEVLGVSKVSTHDDIKGAYYKLSMLLHPDKNKENEEAAEKFREITAAYEVLGNFRLRKLYDKGIIHTADEVHKHKPTAEEHDNDPTTKFYKARMKKEHRTASGRTVIYDFDEWTDAHYGGEFKRQQRLKQNNSDKQERTVSAKQSFHSEMLLLILTTTFVLLALTRNNLDVDRTTEKKQRDSK